MANKFSKWIPLSILSAAVGVVTMDMTVTNVSLSAIITSLHTNLRTFQWIVTSYSLVLGALTITGGRLSDLFGRKKMFLTGAVLFALGSITTAMAHRAGVMLLGEGIINGVGAALMLPSSSALVLSMYQGRKERAIAFGIYTGIAGLAASIGPLLGGYLTTYHSWRWAYLINPFIILVLLACSRALRESRETNRKPRIDTISVALSSLGLASIVYGVIESSVYGWVRAKEPFALFGHALWFNTVSVAFSGLVVGTVLLVAFIRYQVRLERQGKVALVSTKLLKNGQYMSGVSTNLIVTAAQYGTIFLMPIFWQIARGYNAFHAGVAGIALPLSILVAAPLGGILTASKGFRPKRVIQVGIFLSFVGLLWLHGVLSMDASALAIAPALATFGIGFGLTLSPIANQTLSAVSVQEAGEASGVNSTFRQVGSSFGQALLGAIAIAMLVSTFVSRVEQKANLPIAAKTAIVQNIQANQGQSTAAGNSAASLPPAIQTFITHTKQDSAIAGVRSGMIVGAGLTAASFVVVTFFLPLNMKASGEKVQNLPSAEVV